MGQQVTKIPAEQWLHTDSAKLYFVREMLGLAGQTGFMWATTAHICKALPLSCHAELALGVLHI